MYTHVLLWKHFTSAEVTFSPLPHPSLSPFGRAPKCSVFSQVFSLYSHSSSKYLAESHPAMRVAGNCCFPNGTHISYVYVWPFPHGQSCNFLERTVNIRFPTFVPPPSWTFAENTEVGVLSGNSIFLPPAVGCKGRVMALGPRVKKAQESECNRPAPPASLCSLLGVQARLAGFGAERLGFLGALCDSS